MVRVMARAQSTGLFTLTPPGMHPRSVRARHRIALPKARRGPRPVLRKRNRARRISTRCTTRLRHGPQSPRRASRSPQVTIGFCPTAPKTLVHRRKNRPTRGFTTTGKAWGYATLWHRRRAMLRTSRAARTRWPARRHQQVHDDIRRRCHFGLRALSIRYCHQQTIADTIVGARTSETGRGSSTISLCKENEELVIDGSFSRMLTASRSHRHGRARSSAIARGCFGAFGSSCFVFPPTRHVRLSRAPSPASSLAWTAHGWLAARRNRRTQTCRADELFGCFAAVLRRFVSGARGNRGQARERRDDGMARGRFGDWNSTRMGRIFGATLCRTDSPHLACQRLPTPATLPWPLSTRLRQTTTTRAYRRTR